MDETTAVVQFRKTQDSSAYEHIYDAYVDIVFSRCLYILVDKDVSEEATQDVMVKVYFALEKFEGRSSLKTWMYRIATNHCFRVLKKRKELSYEELIEDGVQFGDDNMSDDILEEDTSSTTDEVLEDGEVTDGEGVIDESTESDDSETTEESDTTSEDFIFNETEIEVGAEAESETTTTAN